MLCFQVNGLRATLARYPNSNPEVDLFPTGYILNGGSWLPPADEDTPVTYTVVLPDGQVSMLTLSKGARDSYEP